MARAFAKISICFLCGKVHTQRPPVCDFCLNALYSLRGNSVGRRELKSRSLWLWQNSSPRAFFELSHAMKQSEVADWCVFAEWMCESFRLPKSGVLVPAPSRRWGTKDHAWCLAKALSNLTGFPLKNILARKGGLQQKHLKKSDRVQFKAELIDPDWQCSDYTTVIIVDDILTTGSTARGCLEALCYPKRYEVWTLIDRAPCGGTPLLI